MFKLGDKVFYSPKQLVYFYKECDCLVPEIEHFGRKYVCANCFGKKEISKPKVIHLEKRLCEITNIEYWPDTKETFYTVKDEYYRYAQVTESELEYETKV